jgi:hypothetical protein
MKVFAPGVLGSADVNEYLVNTKFVEKATATTRTSTTTLTADPDLQLHLDTNKTYWIEMIAPFTSPGPGTAGFKFSFFIPAGAVFTGYAMSVIGGVISIYTYSSAGNALTLNVATGASGGGVDDLITLSGIIDTAGSAANIGYQWCQNSSNAGNTIVRAGSSMSIWRVS